SSAGIFPVRSPYELEDLPRLADADGDRAGSPVHALHGGGGEAARRGAGEPAGRFARYGRDLLRSRTPRLQRGAHRSEARRGAARNALVRPSRVDDDWSRRRPDVAALSAYAGTRSRRAAAC